MEKSKPVFRAVQREETFNTATHSHHPPHPTEGGTRPIHGVVTLPAAKAQLPGDLQEERGS